MCPLPRMLHSQYGVHALTSVCFPATEFLPWLDHILGKREEGHPGYRLCAKLHGITYCRGVLGKLLESFSFLSYLCKMEMVTISLARIIATSYLGSYYVPGFLSSIKCITSFNPYAIPILSDMPTFLDEQIEAKKV